MSKKEPAILDEFLTSAVVPIHMTGMRQSKEAFIRPVKYATLNDTPLKHQVIQVNIRGRKSELTRTRPIHAAVFSGSG